MHLPIQNSQLHSKRLTAQQALSHPWLIKLPARDTELVETKTKLKRYVIKKRWIKAVNTIIALRRMGANLDCNSSSSSSGSGDIIDDTATADNGDLKLPDA